MDIKNCNCGGEGKLFIHTLPANRQEVYYTIYCKKCGISTPSSTSLSEVLEIWNNIMEKRIRFISVDNATNVTNNYTLYPFVYPFDKE
jgi:hypothetical protein